MGPLQTFRDISGGWSPPSPVLATPLDGLCSSYLFFLFAIIYCGEIKIFIYSHRPFICLLIVVWWNKVIHIYSHRSFIWSHRWWHRTTAWRHCLTSSMSVMDTFCSPSGHVVVAAASNTVTCVCIASKTCDRVDEMTSTSRGSTGAKRAGGCVSTARITCCSSLAMHSTCTASTFGDTSNRPISPHYEYSEASVLLEFFGVTMLCNSPSQYPNNPNI